ncbi:MAG: acetylglucosamine-6-sulfatase, partial [Acidobacteriota bacterium]
QGLWDLDELYDLQADPLEMQNLIDSPAHKSIALEMNKKLFATLESTAGLYIPLNPDRTLNQSNLRNPDASRSAPFPDSFSKP